MAEMYDTQFPHVKWIDLQGEGIATECAVLKEDGNGNVYFLEIGKLIRLIEIV
mgnify:CR=1 FL=1